MSLPLLISLAYVVGFGAAVAGGAGARRARRPARSPNGGSALPAQIAALERARRELASAPEPLSETNAVRAAEAIVRNHQAARR